MRNAPIPARSPRQIRRPLRSKPPTLKVATWNVHSLQQQAKRLTLLDDLCEYKIDIIVLTETWLPTCTSAWSASNGHTYSVFNSGQLPRGQGVAIAVDSRYNDCIAGYWAVSPRLVRLRIQQDNKYLTILGAYAPVSSAPPDDLAEFSHSLQQQIDLVPATDFLIVAGDFNARIGSDAPGSVPAVGRWGERAQNDAGRELLTLLAGNSLRIMNPYFRHRPVQRYTYPSARSIIDFIAVRRRHHTFVCDVRVRRGTALTSDHHMVVAKMNDPLRVRRAPRRQQPTPPEQPSIKIELLRSPAIQRTYQALICTAADAASDIDTTSVEASWLEYKTACIQAAITACSTRQGKRQRGKSGAWTPELKEAVLAKRAAKRALLSACTDTAKVRLRQQLKGACRSLRQATRSRDSGYWKRAAAQLQSNYHKNVKCFWRFVRKWRKPEPDVVPLPIQRADGVAITKPADIRARWKEYFSDLLNPPTFSAIPAATHFLPSSQPPEPLISELELRNAISRLNCGKSAGNDGIFPEMIKFSGAAGTRWLLALCNKCLVSRTVPADWQRSVVVPIYKKGDRRDCGNYRGISLLSVPGKVYAYVLERRLRTIAEPLLRPSQVGFRTGRGCHDGMFALHEIFERRLEYEFSLLTKWGAYIRVFFKPFCLCKPRRRRG